MNKIEINFDKSTNKAVAIVSNKVIGQCEYIENENTWNIVHTSVDKTYQGQGIARKLVECVIEKAQENNKQLIADCQYAKRVIEQK